MVDREKKLSIDFSALGVDPRRSEEFNTVKQAVDREHLLHFDYLNNKLEESSRVVEPLTIAFAWRSWYLFAWCRTREDFRVFRISRIRNPEIQQTRIVRRDASFADYFAVNKEYSESSMIQLKLNFAPSIASMVEEFYPDATRKRDGSLMVETSMTKDESTYGFLLSYGPYLTILEPPEVRKKVKQMAQEVVNQY